MKVEYVSKCCKADTYLKTSVSIKDKEGNKIPFRNNHYCKKCNCICLFEKKKGE